MSSKTTLSKLIREQVREVALSECGSACIEQAYAKVNLRLKVLGRREDGYHLLSMLNCSSDLADDVVVTFSQSPDLFLRVEPEGILKESPESNLAIRAYRAFWRAFDIDDVPVGCEILIRKRIPIGAGLGGGSADAAAVLRVLSRSFKTFLLVELGLSEQSFRNALVQAALSCGADVPYSLGGGLACVWGIGEQVRQVQDVGPWPGELVLVVPPVAVPTKAFYDLYRRNHPTLPLERDTELERFCEHPSSQLTRLIANDFELDIVEMAPQVGEVLSQLRAVFGEAAGVTGSGSALFILVDPKDSARMNSLERTLLTQGVSVYRTRMIDPRPPQEV